MRVFCFLLCLLLPTHAQPKTIMLNERNVLSLRGRIDGGSSAQLIKQLNLYEEEKIYLYITSPGGSVLNGLQIIEQIETMAVRGIAVYCIADFAASMAFAIFQACPTRYTTSSSILMQHQMSLSGLKGNLYNVENYIEFVRQTDNRLDSQQAQRLNLSVDLFQQKIMNDWWLSGEDILKYGASDAEVRIYCQPGLVGKTDRLVVQAFFFDVDVVYSKCPLVREPLSIAVKHAENQTAAPVDAHSILVLDYFSPSKYISLIEKKGTKDDRLFLVSYH